jgi:hypothetical protein
MKNAAMLQADAWEALRRGLGLADALRYRVLFDPGHGDYAKERKELFASMTLDDWIGALRSTRAKRGAARRG